MEVLIISISISTQPLKAPLTSVLIACPNYSRKTALSSSPFLALKEIALQEFRKRRRCWRKRSTNQFSKQETNKGLRRPEKEKESHWGKKSTSSCYWPFIPPLFPVLNPCLSGSWIRPTSEAPHSWQILRERRIIRLLQKRIKDRKDKESSRK